MNKPHKHAALIKAWADGAEIQCRHQSHLGAWVDAAVPQWHIDWDYRIKPKTIKYRNFLWKTGSEQLVVCVTNEQENYIEPRINWSGFLEWLGDWQEVEV